MKPLISIIVPVYNVESFLPQCLDSLVDQTMREIEIICVNDGSPDNSLSILKEYAEKDNRIVVIDQPNSGVSIARNAALKHVSGEYYMFVDSDDWLDSETCKVAYNYAMQNHADCLMFSYTKEFAGHSIVNHIFPHDYFVWNKQQVSENFHRRLFGPIGDELAVPQDTDIIVTPCMQLFRTEKFKHIPFVDLREVGTFEDGLYQMVLYKECNKFVYIDRPFYHYRKTNEGSITTKYKADLYDKWQNLYDIINRYIEDWKLGNDYKVALQNRITMGVIGLGLNQVHSDDNIFNGGWHLRKMISTPRYKDALGGLKICQMPISWKVFFLLAKLRLTTLLFTMLKVIEYLRTHQK